MAGQLRILTSISVLLVFFHFESGLRAEGRPPYGQGIVGSLLEEPMVIDPVSVRTHTDMTVVSLLFDTLYRVQADGIEPHLANALPDRSDPLHVRVSLRAGVELHDGRVLRARDVVASLMRVLDSSAKYSLDTVVSIETLGTSDPEVIVFHLRTPDSSLARKLTNVRTAVTAGGRRPTWKRPGGSGPFQIRERSTRQKKLRLVAFEMYFAGRSYLDELTLRWHYDRFSEVRFYEKGKTHLSHRGDIAFAGHKPKFRTKLVQAEPWILAYLGFGQIEPITADTGFRQAVSAAIISRAGMMKIGSGELVSPTDTPVPTQMRLHRRPSVSVGSVDSTAAHGTRAQQLMATLALKFPILKTRGAIFELLVNKSRPDDAVIAGRVAAALFAFGVRIRIVSLPAPAFFRRVTQRRCGLYIGQLAVTTFSRDDVLRGAFAVDGRGDNISEVGGALELRFARELPLVPLFQRGLRIHHRSDVHGLSFAHLTRGTPGARILYEELFLMGAPERN